MSAAQLVVNLAILAVLGRILFLLEVMFQYQDETPEPEPRPLSSIERAAQVRDHVEGAYALRHPVVQRVVTDAIQGANGGAS